MKIKLGLIGGKELDRALEKMSTEKKRRVKGEVYAAGIDIQAEAKDRLYGKKGGQRAWDKGHLAGSIIVERSPDGEVVEVGPTMPYAPYVEYGTRPFWPKPGALEEWARKHGFDSTWPICKAIAKRGLTARPFLFPAFLAIEKIFWKRIKEILK